MSENFAGSLVDVFKAIAPHLTPEQQKQVIRDFVARSWPPLPSFSTLSHAVIEETQKASVSGGALLTFFDKAEQKRKIVMIKAGAHYGQTEDDRYMIPGGFTNLSSTEGSSLVPPSDNPESIFVSIAREIEEELITVNGAPLINVDPSRLQLVDTHTISFPWGEKRIVVGAALDLDYREIANIKDHIQLCLSDPMFREQAASHTINNDSGFPETDSIEILEFDDFLSGQYKLLHPDQLSLIEKAKKHYEQFDLLTMNPDTKIVNIERLQNATEKWKHNQSIIGITSGVFDIVHPGHISFLEDAKAQCDRLIVIIASDRTVQIAKGQDKPIISEEKRARTIAGLQVVDAVVISDEIYHENILRALTPDILFKGDDYAGKTIIGADLVKGVHLIPCAEKLFYSSSALIERIRRPSLEVK